MRFLRACVNFFRLGHGNDHPDCQGNLLALLPDELVPGVQRLGALRPLAVRAGICLPSNLARLPSITTVPSGTVTSPPSTPIAEIQAGPTEIR